ncbi:MAG TPA: hypothetical protein VHL58_00880 [Thermoanaerobaculia bacterium]|nr:hypothetical protein [Thermoanaerobaculia bacterium]
MNEFSAGKSRHIDFGASALVGLIGEPLSVRRERRSEFLGFRMHEGDDFPITFQADDVDVLASRRSLQTTEKDLAISRVAVSL